MSIYNARRERLIKVMNESGPIVVQDQIDKKVLFDLIKEGHVVRLSFGRYALSSGSHHKTN